MSYLEWSTSAVYGMFRNPINGEPSVSFVAEASSRGSQASKEKKVSKCLDDLKVNFCALS